MIKNILLVCTGNTCRSSMAEYYLRNLLREKFPNREFNVYSAGISAVPNSRASQNAIEVMKEEGIDLSGHLATQLTPEHLIRADIILTMTDSQKRAIINLVPSVRDKVFLLKQYMFKGQEAIFLQKAVEEVLDRIKTKQEEFWAENGETIRALQKRREQLLKELRNLEAELKAWEEKLSLVAEGEQRKLYELEEKLADLEIVDPFGQSKEVYRQCAEEIKQSLQGFVKWLEGMEGKQSGKE
ncbi:MAG TPA: protein tyrosine phosphatase [Clostridia bacterium]|nr:protein tyrosine phosphatase [Clostridia bacterium]